ncbi:putative mRNA-decapping enzyme subunit 1, PH-like domain superfamily [Helianthus anomalus]
MSKTGELVPNLDQNSMKILNLTVLQRMDPYIEEILMTAAYVTFYEFNVDLNQWTSKQQSSRERQNIDRNWAEFC